MIVWQGHGWVPAISTIGPIMLLVAISNDIFERHSWVLVLVFWFSAAVCYVVAKHSGEDDDHLMYIPLRFWTVILAIAGPVIFVALGGSSPHGKSPSPQAPVAATQKPKPPESALAPQPPVSLAATFVPSAAEENKQAAMSEPEAPIHRIEQVYADNRTKTYFPDTCSPRPETAYQIAKSVAVRQGYRLAPSCVPHPTHR